MDDPAPMLADTHPVLTAIAERAANGSRPRQRNDARKIALVIEGGGMRGVVSGGMVTALEQLGLLHCFDLVVGSSAGACAGAYFLAGQAEYGTRIYFEDINNTDFIDRSRPLRGRPVVDIDFLIDYIMRDVKPLDSATLLNTGIDFYIVCTDLDDGSAYVANKFRNKNTILEAIKASSKLPLLAGLKSVLINGRRCMDGGICHPIPLDIAIKAGATHVLALPTRPLFRPDPDQYPLFERLTAFALGKLISSALQKTYRRRHRIYAETIRHLQSGSKRSDGGCPAIFGVFMPEDKSTIVRTERRADVLRQGARDGAQAVRAAFADVCLENTIKHDLVRSTGNRS